MVTPPMRARVDYDYLIKLLLIGDAAYYRGAMGILLVYDVTDESSFNRTGFGILVGNKANMDESKRAMPTSRGQALEDEFGLKFFETSAKTNLNVEQVFFSIARDIKQRLSETDTKGEDRTIRINNQDQGAGDNGTSAPKSACCGSYGDWSRRHYTRN